MIEDEEILHIILISPPTLFDVAVIARTLYVGGGPYRWRITLVRSKDRHGVKLDYARLASESRVPLSVVLHRVTASNTIGIHDIHPCPRQVLVLDYDRGTPPWELEGRPQAFIVSYNSSADGTPQTFLDESACIERIEYTKGLGLGLPTYDAIAAVYELLIRSRPSKAAESTGLDTTVLTVSEALYLARRVLEALTTFDNYPLLEPNTLMYALRRITLRRGILLDDLRTNIRLDSVEGTVVEEIDAKVYDRRSLQTIGEARVRFDGSTVRFSIPRIGDIVFAIDLLHATVCVARDLCVSRQPREEVLEGIPSLLSSTTGETENVRQ